MVGIDESGSAKWLTDTFTEAMKMKLTTAAGTIAQAGGHSAIIDELAVAAIAYEYAVEEKKAVEAMKKLKADKYHNIFGGELPSVWSDTSIPATPDQSLQQFAEKLAEEFKSVGIGTVPITPPSHKVVYSPLKAKDVQATPTTFKYPDFHHVSMTSLHKGYSEAGVECKCGAVAMLERVSDHLYCSSCLMNVLDCQCTPVVATPNIGKIKLSITQAVSDALLKGHDVQSCPSCGGAWDGYSCTYCKYPDNEEDTQYCPNCDNEWDGDYCYECGYPEDDVGEKEEEWHSVEDKVDEDEYEAENETHVLNLS